MFSLASLYPSPNPTNQQQPISEPIFPASAQSIAILDGDGRLPASSPIHLALTHLAHEDKLAEGKQDAVEAGERENRRVLILTREPGEWASSFLRDGEDWMRTHGGRSGVLKRLDRIDIKYCPTATHLALLLSMLSTEPEKASHPSLSIDGVPSLVILHSPSLYFFEDTSSDDAVIFTAIQGSIASSYGSLLQLALQLTNHYANTRSTSCRLAIFEPLASSLSLPIMSYRPSRPTPKVESVQNRQIRLAQQDKEVDQIPKVTIVNLVSSVVDLAVVVPPRDNLEAVDEVAAA